MNAALSLSAHDLTTPPLNVGILNPSWTVLRHNTDQVCVNDLATMNPRATGLMLQFLGTPWQQLWGNLGVGSQRVFKRSVLPALTLEPDERKIQVLYRYGLKVPGLVLSDRNKVPLMSTVGYPCLRHVMSRGDLYMEEEAQRLDRHTSDSALIHFHTDAMREQYLLRRPAQASRCLSIPFYLPQLEFLSESEVRAKFDEQETRVLFVGADGSRKGLEDLCRALDLKARWLHANGVHVHVVSRHAPNCQLFKHVSHQVRVGRDAVQSLMRRSHVYCMVPRHESFGLVYVEAMAAGCAVIADDDLPRQEILDGGRCGRLVPARSPLAIADALSGLVQDRAGALSLALSGQRRAAQRYEPSRVAAAYAGTFRRMAG
ncbi:glycosyltransferase [Hydrogenophaga sp.]|uniref:glycosyltransferase family 4 protein n=1 Tax=Hydrogenophaga sp. TaxID=1904254 RepID=UPI002607C1E0|nr:glycosyltransferase [Hydrogenophaga sp.]MDM7948606.1 glycosyltransferase [Hydrogenophaga sp.]